MSTRIPPLRWIESSPRAILKDPDKDVWHSGKAIDLLHLGGNRLLVGSETGGVWVAEPDGTARPVSNDWEYPNVLCLTRRLGFGPNTFLCGTEGGLYKNVPVAADPLGTWRRLNLPPGVSDVRRIVTLDGGLIAIATNNGIWWAEHGNADIVVWHQALWRQANGTLVALGGGWNGLARTGDRELAAGTLGPPLSEMFLGVLKPTTRFHPLMWGQFVGELIFEPAAFPSGSVPEPDLRNMKYITIASCEAEPKRVYAVSFHDTTLAIGGKLEARIRVFHLLRSDDGGKNWRRMSNVLTGPTHPAEYTLDLFARDDEAGGPIKNITVHPTLPDRMAFAAYISFVSENGGGSWTPIGGKWDDPDESGVSNAWQVTPPHLHIDQHTVLFAPEPSSPERIFIATDGGVFRAEDWNNPDSFKSVYNRELRTLQFYSPASYRSFLGSVGSTPWTRGVAAGGLQDNGNIWKPDNTRGIWRPGERPGEEGDGGFNLPLGPDRYFHQNHDGAVLVTQWSGVGDLPNRGTQVPVRGPGGDQLYTPIEPVQHPAFRDDQGHLLHALGWKQNTLFGLFGDDDAGNPFWQGLGGLANAQEVIFTAVSHDGSEVLLATSSNNIYRLDTASGDLQQMTVTDLPMNAGGGEPNRSDRPGSSVRGVHQYGGKGAADRAPQRRHVGGDRRAARGPAPYRGRSRVRHGCR